MEIPVALFMFKRMDTLLQIIERIRYAKPSKVYLISDQGRNDEEKKQVEAVRRTVENAIDWECAIVKDYAEENRGVYENIGLGALRVFEREERAIFLEDDNLPEVSFFRYCEEMLSLYEEDDNVLWVCGTNYYTDINGNKSGDNYYFTQHLLPCGWASWGRKFTKYYDKNLLLLDDSNAMLDFKNSYESAALYKQQLRDILDERERKKSGKRYISWDYHMLLSLRAQKLFGIVPARNQITNIGDDINSIHGGTDMSKEMTSRFCQVRSKQFDFPICKKDCEKNERIERELEKIILYPRSLRIRIAVVRKVKEILKVPFDRSLRDVFSFHKAGR